MFSLRALGDALPDDDDRGSSANVVGLCVGASQDPQNIDGFTDSQQSTLSQKMRRRRAGNPLPDILKDVRSFNEMLHQLDDVEVLKPVVGRDGGKLTRGAFINLVEDLINVPPKLIYLLYYAGHGSQNGGALVMEDGLVSLNDIISVWERRPGRLRGQKLILIADSCHSGGLIRHLQGIPKRDRDTLNIGIQAACSADELSSGGIFTEVFTLKQLHNKNFQWLKRAEEQGCDVEKIQHPCFYTTWGTNTATTPDGFEFRFYKRAE
jgi:hypothetical protein